MGEEMLPQPAPMEAPPVLEPTRVKVFGIIHIVLGGIGLLYMGANMLAMMFRGALEKLGSTGQPPEMVEFQKQFNEATAASSWISIGIGMVVSVLILIAGIALVRRKKNSVKLSNVYAWASLAAKVLGIVIFVAMVSPALNRLMDDMTADAPSDVKTMMTAVKAFATVVAVLLPILMAVYPVLSLVMLNKPAVKDYLAREGK